jgi:hypothetical protein
VRSAARLTLGLAILLGACDGSRPQAPPLDRPTRVPGPSDGACSQIDVDGATALRFEVHGSCLSGGAMVLYRCSPTAVPILRISSVRGPALFLGGPFAVRVTTLPAQVRFAGAAAGTEVLIADPPTPRTSPSISPSPSIEGDVAPDPEPQRLVYVRQDGSTERWLRLQGRRTLNDPPVAWAIGDSILDGGRDLVEAGLADWSLTLDAEPGRSSSSAAVLAEAAVEHDADAVVIELGTNDSSGATFREHLIETLDVLEGVPLVIWQTARGPADDASISAVNAAIRELVPAYPNAAIADWEAFVPEEALQGDGIHPGEGSLHLEAELLVPMLSGWRDAVSRDGATSCGRAVVRATT